MTVALQTGRGRRRPWPRDNCPLLHGPHGGRKHPPPTPLTRPDGPNGWSPPTAVSASAPPRPVQHPTCRRSLHLMFNAITIDIVYPDSTLLSQVPTPASSPQARSDCSQSDSCHPTGLRHTRQRRPRSASRGYSTGDPVPAQEAYYKTFQFQPSPTDVRSSVPESDAMRNRLGE